MNKQKVDDLLMGSKNEDYAADIIKNYLNLKDLNKLEKYDPFDFYNKEKDIYFEVKSRRVNHNKYETTMIGYNKIIEAKKHKTVYFIFIFNDGNYYYKFNSVDNFDISIGGRCDRNKSEYKDYYYIPISKLIKF